MQCFTSIRFHSVILPTLKNTGADRFSLDRCNYDAITRGGLDSPFGTACSSMLFNTWWSVDIVGGRHESVWRTVFGCWLVHKCRYVDVVVIFIVFSTIPTLLLSGALWPQSRSKWRLHSTIFTGFKGIHAINEVVQIHLFENIHPIFFLRIFPQYTFMSRGMRRSVSKKQPNALLAESTRYRLWTMQSLVERIWNVCDKSIDNCTNIASQVWVN